MLHPPPNEKMLPPNEEELTQFYRYLVITARKNKVFNSTAKFMKKFLLSPADEANQKSLMAGIRFLFESKLIDMDYSNILVFILKNINDLRQIVNQIHQSDEGESFRDVIEGMENATPDDKESADKKASSSPTSVRTGWFAGNSMILNAKKESGMGYQQYLNKEFEVAIEHYEKAVTFIEIAYEDVEKEKNKIEKEFLEIQAEIKALNTAKKFTEAAGLENKRKSLHDNLNLQLKKMDEVKEELNGARSWIASIVSGIAIKKLNQNYQGSADTFDDRRLDFQYAVNLLKESLAIIVQLPPHLAENQLTIVVSSLSNALIGNANQFLYPTNQFLEAVSQLKEFISLLEKIPNEFKFDKKAIILKQTGHLAVVESYLASFSANNNQFEDAILHQQECIRLFQSIFQQEKRTHILQELIPFKEMLANILRSYSDYLYRKNNYLGAIAIQKAAVSIYKANFELIPNDYSKQRLVAVNDELFSIYISYGNQNEKQNNFKEAVQLYKNALDVLLTMPAEVRSPDKLSFCIKSIGRIAEHYLEKKDFESAINHYAEILNYLNRMHDKDSYTSTFYEERLVQAYFDRLQFNIDESKATLVETLNSKELKENSFLNRAFTAILVHEDSKGLTGIDRLFVQDMTSIPKLIDFAIAKQDHALYQVLADSLLKRNDSGVSNLHLFITQMSPASILKLFELATFSKEINDAIGNALEIPNREETLLHIMAAKCNYLLTVFFESTSKAWSNESVKTPMAKIFMTHQNLLYTISQSEPKAFFGIFRLAYQSENLKNVIVLAIQKYDTNPENPKPPAIDLKSLCQSAPESLPNLFNLIDSSPAGVKISAYVASVLSNTQDVRKVNLTDILNATMRVPDIVVTLVKITERKEEGVIRNALNLALPQFIESLKQYQPDKLQQLETKLEKMVSKSVIGSNSSTLFAPQENLALILLHEVRALQFAKESPQTDLKDSEKLVQNLDASANKIKKHGSLS